MPSAVSLLAMRGVRSMLTKLGYEINRRAPDDRELELAYVASGRRPWSQGYEQAKQHLIQRALADSTLLEAFSTGGGRLPGGYGIGFDERCIELPWLIANLPSELGRLLDAGSALNHSYLLDQDILKNRELHILTLGPEMRSYPERGISYLYADLRDIPIRDCYYDAIACISTLEHVGLDNSIYTKDSAHCEHRPYDFELVIAELHRVLKPGGTLLFTVPFGLYQDLGVQQQFDSDLLEHAIGRFPAPQRLTQAFYRYSLDGWQLSSAQECERCEYVHWVSDAWRTGRWPDTLPVEPDLAAAARAVACIRLSREARVE